jgi:putative Mn2+ efflux pump MntP
MKKGTNAHRNRFLITAVVLGTFFLIMMGIGAAILGDGHTPAINQEWKEILLLVLGAFLGSYSRIIDFWFNGNDMNMDGVPDGSPADDSPPCPDCNEPDDELDNLY